MGRKLFANKSQSKQGKSGLEADGIMPQYCAEERGLYGSMEKNPESETLSPQNSQMREFGAAFYKFILFFNPREKTMANSSFHIIHPACYCII